MIPLGIFVFYGKLLKSDKTWKQIFYSSLILASIGAISFPILIGSENMLLTFVGLPIPLGIHKLLKTWFIKEHGRPPIDTAFDMNSNVPMDRLFNIVYAIVAAMVPITIFILLENVSTSW